MSVSSQRSLVNHTPCNMLPRQSVSQSVLILFSAQLVLRMTHAPNVNIPTADYEKPSTVCY